jgi:hypothetical protein
MMTSSNSRARAGYTMVPKDDTTVAASAPFVDPNEEDDMHREQGLADNHVKVTGGLNRDR